MFNVPVIPQFRIEDLLVEHILPNNDDFVTIRSNFIKIISDIAAEHIPRLSFMKHSMPKIIKGPYNDLLAEKTEVIPLEVLPFNEQYYDDDIKILSNYERLVHNVFQKANTPLQQIHIGGDQLTRERFSHSKRLRLGVNHNPGNFSCLSPITAEFFHLDMNFLEKVIFRRLYSDLSDTDLGTMKCEMMRIHRTNVKADAHKAYEADMQFFCSFVKAYVVEMLLEYFGMEDINSQPSRHAPPTFTDAQEIEKWVINNIGQAVDDFMLNIWRGTPAAQMQNIGTVLHMEELIQID